MRFLAVFAIVFGVLVSPQIGEAQLTNSDSLNPAIDISLQPSHPQPGDTVQATLNDYRTSSRGAQLTWYLDNEPITTATNQREISFVAGPNGVEQSLAVRLNKPTGGTETINTSITPRYLDIILEPQTRVPDFFMGRALPSVGSVVNASAITAIDTPTTDLTYRWTVDGKVLEYGPIRGGSHVSFETPYGSSFVLSLQVSDLSGDIIAKRSIRVPSVKPKLVFYEVNALHGIRHTAILDELQLIGNSAVVRAEPYYLDSRVYNNPSIMEWEVDNRQFTPSGSNPYEVTLEKNSDSGAVRLSLHVRSTTVLLQGVEDEIGITF